MREAYREAIRSRLKFNFILVLFFMPVGLCLVRSRLDAWVDAPRRTEPLPGLREFCQRIEDAESDDNNADDDDDGCIPPAFPTADAAAAAAAAGADTAPVNATH